MAVFSARLNSDAKVLKKATDEIRKLVNDSMSFIAVFADNENDKINIYAYVSDNEQNTSKLRANEWVNSVLTSVGGKGGGRPSVAQGSIGGVTNFDSLVRAAQDVLDKCFSTPQ